MGILQEILKTLSLPEFYFAMFRSATPVLLTTLGAMISSRSGTSNIALEGTMLISAFVGVVVGLFSKKLNLQEGEFSKKQAALFALANIVAHLLAWVLVAPVLDIAIYAEPVKKVFAQGAFAAVSNSITAVVVGGLLVLAYTRTIAKKGSLDQE